MPTAGLRVAKSGRHHARAVIDGEARDPRPDSGDGDRPDRVLACQSKGIGHRRPQLRFVGATAKAHARGVDDVARRQRTRAGDCGLPNVDRPVGVALGLDGRPATPANRAGDSAAEREVVVRCVDDRIDILFDEVARQDQDARRSPALISATRASS